MSVTMVLLVCVLPKLTIYATSYYHVYNTRYPLELHGTQCSYKLYFDIAINNCHMKVPNK